MFNCVLKWISAGSAFALFLSTVPVDVLAVSKTQVTVSVNEVKRKNYPTTDTKDDQDITTADQNTSTSKKEPDPSNETKTKSKTGQQKPDITIPVDFTESEEKSKDQSKDIHLAPLLPAKSNASTTDMVTLKNAKKLLSQFSLTHEKLNVHVDHCVDVTLVAPTIELDYKVMSDNPDIATITKQADNRLRIQGNSPGKARFYVFIDKIAPTYIGEVQVYANTDVNQDGLLTSEDVAFVQKHMGKDKKDPTWAKIKNADVNRDGRIDSHDKKLVQQQLDQYKHLQSYERVILIGISGLGNANKKIFTPNMDSLIKNGTYTYAAKPVAEQKSAENWASILLGVPPEEHGITSSNVDTNSRTTYSPHASVIRWLHEERPEAHIGAFTANADIRRGILEEELAKVDQITMNTGSQNLSDAEVAKQAASYILHQGNKNRLTFVQLQGPKLVANQYGYHSAKYTEAVRKVDQEVGLILKALEIQKQKNKSLILLVTDEGADVDYPTSTNKFNRLTWAVSGPDIKTGNNPNSISTMDTAAVIVEALKLNKPTVFAAKVPRDVFGKDVKVKSIRINKSRIKLDKGDTVTVRATVSPKDATNQNVEWKSKNKRIATVKDRGKGKAEIKGKREGTTYVYVISDDGDKEDRVKVIVEDDSSSGSGANSRKDKENNKEWQREMIRVVEKEGGRVISKVVHFDKKDNFSYTVDGRIDISTTAVFHYDDKQNRLSYVPADFEYVRGETRVKIRDQRLTGTFALATFKKTFRDMYGHWARHDVELLANKLMIYGQSSNYFVPEQPITRAEFVAMVIRALGEQEGSGSRFSDVYSSAWYAGAVETARSRGYVLGYENRMFGPNKTITRQEMAVIMKRILEKRGLRVKITTGQQATFSTLFHDLGQLAWGKRDLAEAYYAGLIQGVSYGYLQPQANATRSHCAVMIKRMIGKLNLL
ncbi:S-layer homology domain-containing protein [Brevibacillus laterosporus]|uniref:S-layer homology domain-containing protein n=1 Tax=Brevibacillus laterosporus TaxID=1465 RepID=UPI002E1EFF62|nr:S-layer homology domain-containing protein [Brevibacillus laterosporus]